MEKFIADFMSRSSGERFFLACGNLFDCYDNLVSEDNPPGKEGKLAWREEGKSDIDETPEILVNGSRIFQTADCHELIRHPGLNSPISGQRIGPKVRVPDWIENHAST